VFSAFVALSLLAGMHAVWLPTTTDDPGLGAVLTASYFVVLGLVIAAFAVRSPQALHRVDLLVLLVAIAVEVIQFHRFASASFVYTVDEGSLTHHAIEAFRHGQNPYRFHWPTGVGPAPTQLMNGHIADTFPYPPLAFVLGAGLSVVWSGFGAPPVLDGLALIATAILTFLVLPRRWRPLAALALFVVPFLTARVVAGAPAIVALPFLGAALWRWHTVGSSGRLSRTDVAKGICLGLAAATQQLVWFAIPFLVVGIWLMRRADYPPRRAMSLVLRYCGVAAATFAVVNLPFVIASPTLWAQRILSVFTQHAVPYGPGVSMLTVHVLSGSSRLGEFTIAAALAYVGLLVGFAAAIRRVGPALIVFATAAFLLSLRSEDTYYVVLAPLIVIGAVGAPLDELATARPVGTTVLSRRSPRVSLAAAFAVPILVLTGLGLFSTRPIQMHVVARTVTPAGNLRSLVVSAHNTSGTTLRPHFLIEAKAKLGLYWRIVSGPAALAAGRSAVYELEAGQPSAVGPAGSQWRLVALSDGPETASVVSVPPA
jgi:hypothetical protein